MSSLNNDEMPPRPPLSVPFPLQLGDAFHPGSALSMEDEQSPKVPGRSENDRVPSKTDESSRTN